MSKNQYAILNHTDKPCEKLICIVYGKIARYINIHWLSLPISSEITYLEEFGFDILEDNFNMVTFKKVRPSIAKYNDGTIREWQDKSEFSIYSVDPRGVIVDL